MLVLNLKNACNNNCLICRYKTEADPAGRAVLEAFYPLDTRTEFIDIKEAIINAMNKDRLVFKGIEPTLFPGFLDLVRLAKDNGFSEISVETNGRRLCYLDFSKMLRDGGATELVITLHGAQEQTHDSITRAEGSFRQTVTGIKNALHYGFKRIRCRVPVHRLNIGESGEIVELLRKLGIRRIELLNLFPFGAAWANLSDLEIGVDEAKAGIDAAVAASLGTRVKLTLKNFPRMIYSGYDEFMAPLDEEKTDERVRFLIGKSPECAGERCARCCFDFFCRSLEKIRNKKSEGATVCAHVNVPSTCDRRCIFCGSYSGQDADYDEGCESAMKMIEREIETGRLHGARAFNISGLEALNFPGLFDVIEAVRNSGAERLIISTTGLKFADREFLERFLERTGGFEIWMPLYGDNAELHDGIVGVAGDFEQVLRAAANLSSRGQVTVKIHTLILRRNYTRLPQLAQRALDAGAAVFSCIFTSPLNIPVEAYAKMVPAMSDAAPFIQKEFITNMLSIPPCILSKHGLLTEKYSSVVTPMVMENTIFVGSLVDTTGCVRCAAADECSLADRCGGAAPEYIMAFGADEFSPV